VGKFAIKKPGFFGKAGLLLVEVTHHSWFVAFAQFVALVYDE